LDEKLEGVVLMKMRNQEKDQKMREEALRVLAETEVRTAELKIFYLRNYLIFMFNKMNI